MTEKYLYERKLNKYSDYNVWFAFPECTSFSLSSLGFLWLFKEIDETENIYIERICTDTEKTVLKPSEVDSIGFSFTFDMDFMNIFSMLEKYNIPFKRSERNNSHPIIFAGGPVLTTNPAPYKDIFDFIIIGDGEGVNVKALNICRKVKKDIQEGKIEQENFKTTLYNELSKVEGIYVPTIHNFNNKVKKSHSKLEKCIYTPILSENSFGYIYN